MTIYTFILICFLVGGCYSLEILIYSIGLANSHFLFYSRVADTLAKHGHTVTRFEPVFNQRMKKVFKPYSNDTKVWQFDVPPSKDFGDQDMNNLFSNIAFNYSAGALMSKFPLMSDIFNRTGSYLASGDLDDRFGEYDLFLAMAFGYGPLAIARKVGVRAIPWNVANAYSEFFANAMGIPFDEAFVPNIMTFYSDQMSFGQRLWNYIIIQMLSLPPGLLNPPARDEQAAFARPPFYDAPNWKELYQDVPCFAMNGAMMLDFPRPVTPHILYLDNLEEEGKSGGALPPDLEMLFVKPVVLFSLGSVASAKTMPETFKRTLWKAFSQLTEYNIIWKFDIGVEEADAFHHIKIVKWLPQRAVLAHKNTAVFITHGGYNSLLEASDVGVPLIMMPLFMDQKGNAERVKRLGYGEVVHDFNALTADVLAAMIRKVATDERYRKRAGKVGAMLRDRVRPPDVMLAHYISYYHKHYHDIPLIRGRLLNRMQYYSIDVIAFLLTVIGIVLAVFVAALVAFYERVKKNL